MADLQRFVKSAVGRNYEFSFSKLLRKRSITTTPEAEPGRSFFCSELIAAAYKRMGFLPFDISSATYLPGKKQLFRHRLKAYMNATRRLH